jgi:hypothetical protein
VEAHWKKYGEVGRVLPQNSEAEGLAYEEFRVGIKEVAIVRIIYHGA